MKATIQDGKTLSALRPLDMVAYLRAHQWREAQRLERGSLWTKEVSQHSFEVLVPLDVTLRDFVSRMADALHSLEEAEGRSQFEIYEDLIITSADVIRPRLPSINSDGAISIEQGVILHEQARNLMLAAACAAIEKRPLFAKRKPEQAMEYLQHAQFGIPQRGSYIMTIISPVSPRIQVGEDLFGNDLEPEEPFERRTVRTLAQGIRAIELACLEVATSGKIDPMKRAVELGVSANLCEAIIGMHEGAGEKGILFTFSWAPLRGIPNHTSSTATISADSVPILKETVRIFRETETVESSEVIGTVNKLEHQGGDHGKVTIIGSADGLPRTVTLDLAGKDHVSAVRSYEDRIPISCIGELTREGRSWILRNPREFRLLGVGA
jgi:hypothetical protein